MEAQFEHLANNPAARWIRMGMGQNETTRGPLLVLGSIYQGFILGTYIEIATRSADASGVQGILRPLFFFQGSLANKTSTG